MVCLCFWEPLNRYFVEKYQMFCLFSFGFHLLQSPISARLFHYSGTVITLEPFLEHRGAVNTVSMETSLRHTLISGLVRLYFSDDEWEPQKLRELQLANAIKRVQYVEEEGSTRAEESLWFLIMKQITNDSYLVLPEQSVSCCCLPSGPESARTCWAPSSN